MCVCVWGGGGGNKLRVFDSEFSMFPLVPLLPVPMVAPFG